jgi:hypothetical protein
MDLELTLLLLFWKRRIFLNEELLGARPQTPWVGFAEFWVKIGTVSRITSVFEL